MVFRLRKVGEQFPDLFIERAQPFDASQGGKFGSSIAPWT